MKVSINTEYDVDEKFIKDELGITPMEAAEEDAKILLHQKGGNPLGEFKVLSVEGGK